MIKKPDFFILKTVSIATANELVEFETKLPGNATHLIGYKVSANTLHATKAFAQVGISFNGSRENTINEDLIVTSPANQGRRSLLLKQKQKLLQNAYAKGFVEDLGVVSVPYTVKIYFHLKR